MGEDTAEHLRALRETLSPLAGGCSGQPHVELARVGLAYHYDEAGVIPAGEPGEGEDDLVVLGHVARLLLQMRGTQEHFVLTSGFRRALEASSARAGALPALQAQLDRWLTWPTDGEGWEAHRDRILEELEVSTATALTTVWNEIDIRDVHWMTHAPLALQDDDTPSVGFYGRTSAGKTTLVRRVLTALSPAGEAIAALLPTDPRAHTTRMPVLFDLDPALGSVLWEAWGYGGLVRGRLDDLTATRDSRLRELLLGREFPGTAYVHLRLPATSAACRTPLRVIDLPGTQGFATGPWADRADGLYAGLDALVLPMDRRFFRREEQRDLLHVLTARHDIPVALAVRAAPATAAELGIENFRVTRLRPALLAARPEGWGVDELNERLGRLPIHVLGRRDGAEGDGLAGLVEWLLRRKSSRRRISLRQLFTVVSRLGGQLDRSQSSRSRQGPRGPWRALANVALLRAYRMSMSAEETGT